MSTDIDAYEISLNAQPDRIAGGGIVQLTAELEIYSHPATYEAAWEIRGPTTLSAQDTRIALLGSTLVTGGHVEVEPGEATRVQATLDTSPLNVGTWEVLLHLVRDDDASAFDEAASASANGYPPATLHGSSGPIDVTPRPFAAGDDVG